MSSIIFLLLFPGGDYLNQHNFDEASRYYRLMNSIAPSYDVCYGAAICALANNKLDRCKESFNTIPFRENETYYFLGVVHYQLGLYEQAFTYFDLLTGRNKNLWQRNYYLSLINLKRGRVPDAVEYLKSIPDSDNKSWLVEYIANYNKLFDAKKKYLKQQYNDAIKLYKGVDDFFGFKEIGLALALTKTGEYKEGLALLDTVINYSGNNQLVAQSTIEAGKICIISNNFSKARYYLNKHLEIMPDDKARFLLGKIFSDEVQYDSAAFYFRILPDSIDEHLFYKGRTDYFLGLWGKSEVQLLRHREHFPNSIYGDRAIYILASINFRRKEYNEAIDFWKELLQIYPTSIYAAAALKGIGDAYFNIGEYKNALSAYRRVKDFEPSTSISEETILKIYETLYYRGKYPSLISALRGFINENTNSKMVPKTHLCIAKILSEKNALYQSLAELDKLIDGYHELSIANEAYIEKARIYKRLGNKSEMKKSLHHLLTEKNAEEYHSYAANELGIIYLEESKYDSALYYYNLLLNFDKYRERAMFEIAKIYYRIGQNKGSETMIYKFISEYPLSVFLLDVYILKSKLHKNQGNYSEAIAVLNELMKKVGQKAEIYVEIGNIYFELEKYPNARDNYLLASEYFKEERDDAAMALILAGDASIAIGDKKSAGEYYLQANLIAKSLTLKNRASEKISIIGGK